MRKMSGHGQNHKSCHDNNKTHTDGYLTLNLWAMKHTNGHEQKHTKTWKNPKN